MGEAVLSVIAGPVISSVVQDVMGAAGGASGSSGGPFDGLLKDFTSAFSSLFGGGASNYPTYSPASSAMPYSTADLSPAAYNNPMSQLQPAMGRFNQYYNGDTIVRDHRHFGSANWGQFNSGTSQDASERAALNNAQGSADQAEQTMLANPDNVADKLDYEKKQQALQDLYAVLQDKAKEKAQMEKEAAQSSLLS
jgi:hypothetical protein